MKRFGSSIAVMVGGTLLFFGLVQLPARAEKVIIKTPRPYDSIVRTIQQSGGTVAHQYK
jgi:hypothetical protein